jgi:vacuolar protein sorting-associated protein 72
MTPMERGSRQNRGSRMKMLLAQADTGSALPEDDFWQTVDNIQVADDDYGGASQDEDSVDSDFDIPEEPELETEVLGEEKEEKKRKTNVYSDPKKRKRKVQQKGSTSSDEQRKKLKVTPVSDRKLRRSTLESSKEIAMLREIAANSHKKRTKKIQKRFSQEFLLQEAKTTEEQNLASYAKMKQIEDDKKKVTWKKVVIKNPKIIETSNTDGCFFTFVGTKLPYELSSTAPESIPKSICPISGLPAKYYDPLSKTPYATIDAFKQIREKYIAENPPTNSDTEEQSDNST